jgi:hypothetical protein
MELFSTAAVENAVEKFAFVWKKNSKKKFSTFPQANSRVHLWKCGKLLANLLKSNKLIENRAVENNSP